jgi:DNA-binding PadR family transcriptional regulator
MRGDQSRGQLESLLLAALAVGPAHGYDVIVRLRDSSHGEFDLAEGTAYPALHRLEAEGLLEGAWERAGGRRRKVYRLTDAGQQKLSEHRVAWLRFSSVMTQILVVPA